MKTIFIPLSSKLKEVPENFSNFFKELPKEIAIFYSIQFKDLAQEIYSKIKKDKKVVLFSQVLGCSNPKISKNTKSILLIGNGRFHAISLAYESKLPVYLYDNGKLVKIAKEEIDKLVSMERAATLNYLSSEKIGILVSTKPGQERLKKALEFKDSLKDKKGYVFLSNEINISEFENYSLKSYVNTACPRMDLVSPRMINLSKVNEIKV